MLLISILCNMSLLSRCIFSWSSDSCQPNLSFKRQSFSSLYQGRVQMHTFPHSLPLAFTTAITSHLNFSLPPSLFAISWETPLIGYDLLLQLGEFLAPIAENNKLFSIIAVNLNASFFDSQLNCHSGKSPINANTRVPSLLWLQ